jgi:hypothetical protein
VGGRGERSLVLYKSFIASENYAHGTYVNPILHTAWLDSHAQTLKGNSAKYYFYEKSRFLHAFLKFCCESRKI